VGDKRSSRGFTLLELLVVTGVIGFLIAILVSALGPLRRSTHITICMSHLRQIRSIYQMYLADYEQYPRPGAVTSGSYLNDRRILFCPEDASYSWRGTASSYRYRYEVPPDFRPLTQVRELDPNTVLAVCEHHAKQQGRDEKHFLRLLPLLYPYHLVLRADGRVEAVHINRLRQFFLPGDRLVFMDAYPGEPGYTQAMR
jgi:prepilin-type N-terminal cleavage/methylation domain-containing protein